MGGNKLRKLEFLAADALREGADTLITAGAIQSNHQLAQFVSPHRQRRRIITFDKYFAPEVIGQTRQIHALREGADTLITAGAIQSNHVRQTAAVAAKLGLHPSRSASAARNSSLRSLFPPIANGVVSSRLINISREYLPRLSDHLGREIFIKRDDTTPLAMGGNKLRKSRRGKRVKFCSDMAPPDSVMLHYAHSYALNKKRPEGPVREMVWR
jgi:hypothetical protein